MMVMQNYVPDLVRNYESCHWFTEVSKTPDFSINMQRKWIEFNKCRFIALI